MLETEVFRLHGARLQSLVVESLLGADRFAEWRETTLYSVMFIIQSRHVRAVVIAPGSMVQLTGHL
jgi:hypothetical protein